MQNSPDHIQKAIEEVMSQEQFRFVEPFDLDLSFLDKMEYLLPIVGYLFLILIICASIFLIGKIVIELFSSNNEKPKIVKPSEVMKEKPAMGLPIQQLHRWILDSLHKKKIVQLQKWKTNTDYNIESNNAIFSDVCKLYDRAVYGNEVIADEDITQLRRDFKEWEDHQ